MPSPSHRKQIKHYESELHLHELTFSCYQRRPLLTNDTWRGLLAESLGTACEVEGFLLLAFVFMPEHVHLLVQPETTNTKLSRLLARTKQPMSKAVRERLAESGSPLLAQLTVRERPGKHCFRFWQEGAGYDRNLWSAKAITASFDYLHENPVRRGLSRRVTDWKWSSARFVQEGVVDTDLPRLTPLDAGWLAEVENRPQ